MQTQDSETVSVGPSRRRAPTQLLPRCTIKNCLRVAFWGGTLLGMVADLSTMTEIKRGRYDIIPYEGFLPESNVTCYYEYGHQNPRSFSDHYACQIEPDECYIRRHCMKGADEFTTSTSTSFLTRCLTGVVGAFIEAIIS